MNRVYRFARIIYHRLPLPLVVKEKIKVGILSLIPSWGSNPIVPCNVPMPAPGSFPPSDRRSKLLNHIQPASQEGLEIGPLASPIITKTESAGRIWYVDHATADVLKEKYRNDPNVRIDEIVDIDYIWGQAGLSELVQGRLFDYVLASHVIEHVPDMLGWLKEVGEVLKDDGILSLAVPDKRYSFDYLRELSTVGMLIEAFMLHRRRPGPREIFDYFSLTSKVDLSTSWAGKLDRTNWRVITN